MVNRFLFLVRRHIISLISKDITIIKMMSGINVILVISEDLGSRFCNL